MIGTPSAVGSGGLKNSGAVSSYTFTTSADIEAGNLVVIPIWVSHSGSLVSVSSVSDGTNSYTKGTNQNGNISTTYFECDVWYVLSAAFVAAGSTVTINFSGVANSVNSGAVMAQCSGNFGSYDTAGQTSSGHSSSPSVTTGTLASNDEIVFGVNFDASSDSFPYTEDAAFTNLYNQEDPAGTNSGLSLGYQIVSSTSAVTHNPSYPVTQFWFELAAPFSEAAGQGVGSATGIATAPAVGAAKSAQVGTATGVATANAISAGSGSAIAVGSSTALAISAATSKQVGTATGTGSAPGLASFTAPAGTYVLPNYPPGPALGSVGWFPEWDHFKHDPELLERRLDAQRRGLTPEEFERNEKQRERRLAAEEKRKAAEEKRAAAKAKAREERKQRFLNRGPEEFITPDGIFNNGKPPSVKVGLTSPRAKDQLQAQNRVTMAAHQALLDDDEEAMERLLAA